MLKSQECKNFGHIKLYAHRKGIILCNFQYGRSSYDRSGLQNHNLVANRIGTRNWIRTKNWIAPPSPPQINLGPGIESIPGISISPAIGATSAQLHPKNLTPPFTQTGNQKR